jgi:very-short-patch-repair endonuclease
MDLRRLNSRFIAAYAISDRQGGVISRRQLYRCGITRDEIRGHIRAHRWQLVCDQVVALHNGEVSERGHRWAAVISAGPRAQLDGIASLVESGLERCDYQRIRVSVPKGARVLTRRTGRYDIRETRRWSRDDRIMDGGVPRTKPAVAVVRAAIWARTDREASYLLSITVQQGLTSPGDVAAELLRIKRHRRRLFVHAVVNDLLDGARALGELDVARELRRHGLPPPARQVLRKDKRGRYYLDLYWPELKLVVEIDGIHHAWAENVVGDALRQNALVLDGDTVLRVPLLGLRLEPDAFFEQIADAIAAAQADLAA